MLYALVCLHQLLHHLEDFSQVASKELLISRILVAVFQDMVALLIEWTVRWLWLFLLTSTISLLLSHNIIPLRSSWNSYHGTQSYINARFKKMNPETRQIQGAIDNWHDNHYKEIGGWPNKAAKLAYEKLVAEREKEVQSQQASSSSSSNVITVNEREIFQKVFGERRGHTVGIGRKLKRPSGLPSSSTTSAPVSYETMQDNTRGSSSHTRSFRPTSRRAK